MTETPASEPHANWSPRWVFIALALAGTVLLIAMLYVLHLGRQMGARHAALKSAVQIELELVRAHLGYEMVLDGNAAVSTDSVNQHLARGDWYAWQMTQVCARGDGRIFVAPVAPLRRKLAILRVELENFAKKTRARWEALRTAEGHIESDLGYDDSFRRLALRGRETKAAAENVIRTERRVLNLFQICLVAGALILAGSVAATLVKYFRRQRQVEKALRESEEKFRCLYSSSSDAIMLLDENSFFDCNEAALRTFQLESYKQFSRKHPADLSPPTQPDGSDSMTLANEMIATAFRNGSHRFEWVHKRTDGTEFPAEVLLSAVQIEGRRVLQAVVRDVTHRKESEERLRANEEQLRSISQAALDAVIMMDAEGNAIHWNPAAEKMFGYASHEVLGKNIHHVLTPERLRDGATRALTHFFETGQGRAVGRIVELQALRKEGEEFPIEISLAPIRIGGRWCAVAVIRDITERKLADEKLRAEQRTLRRLLKAHDQESKLIAYEIHDGLAQRLVAAIMQCQAATRKGSAAQVELAPHLLELLRQCLSETRRLISGVRPPILDEFGVVTAIEGLLEETEVGGGPEIEFRNSVSFDRLEPVLENTIYRVIQESVGNACRHSRSPRVLIDLAQQADRIRIRVQDWGIGFDPQQVDRGRYGLAGIRERARLLGGDVCIDSQPGTGTTVDVDLPVDVGDLSE